VDRLLAGKPIEEPDRPKSRPIRPIAFDELGIVLVPEVLPRTPPYVDFVRPDSPAARAGLRPDDLVVLVNDRLVQSCKMLREELDNIDREAAVRVSVMRGSDLVEVTFAASKL
ncbi:MAG: PDZ domain-containing protein, partial [Pirellulaceae bacterium]|nr:PDZ domain-containing protein [Pirellulaceae bacterium]